MIADVFRSIKGHCYDDYIFRPNGNGILNRLEDHNADAKKR